MDYLDFLDSFSTLSGIHVPQFEAQHLNEDRIKHLMTASSLGLQKVSSSKAVALLLSHPELFKLLRSIEIRGVIEQYESPENVNFLMDSVLSSHFPQLLILRVHLNSYSKSKL